MGRNWQTNVSFTGIKSNIHTECFHSLVYHKCPHTVFLFYIYNVQFVCKSTLLTSIIVIYIKHNFKNTIIFSQHVITKSKYNVDRGF